MYLSIPSLAELKEALQIGSTELSPLELALILCAEQKRGKKLPHYIVDRETQDKSVFDTICSIHRKINFGTRLQVFVYDMKHWVLYDIKKLTDGSWSIFLYDSARRSTYQIRELIARFIFADVKFKIYTTFFEDRYQYEHNFCAFFALDAAFRLEHVDLHTLLTMSENLEWCGSNQPCGFKYDNTYILPHRNFHPDIIARLFRNIENAKKQECYLKTYGGVRVNNPNKPYMKTLAEYAAAHPPIDPLSHDLEERTWGLRSIYDKSNSLIKKTLDAINRNLINDAEFREFFNRTTTAINSF